MSARIRVGDRVVHPELGAGVVRRLRRGGRALLVSFDSNPKLLLETRGREVRPEPGAPKGSPDAVGGDSSATQKPMATADAAQDDGPFRRRQRGRHDDTPDAHEAARTLEALRLGVVPRSDLRPSSVGRSHELELVRRDLDEAAGAGSARVLLGDYGTGKTHMLEIVEREALGRGFLVGRATLEAEYVRPSHPMRIYREVVTSLVYPDQETVGAGLEPLLRRAVADDALMDELGRGEGPFGSHIYLRPALHYFAALDGLDDPVPRDLLLDWISGQRPHGNQELDGALRALARTSGAFASGPKIYSLKDFQPWAHVYSNLLGGLSVLARRVGYQGLVLLLDEAENYDLLGSEARTFADSVFSCLVLSALDEAGVLFSEGDLVKGGFPPQRRLPARFAPQQHLYFVSAMTPSTGGESLLRRLAPAHHMTELRPLDQQSYHELSRRVAAIFERAHPEMSLAERLSRPLGDVLWTLIDHDHIASPREATKLTVEFLDLIRLRRDALPTFLADVKRTLT